MVPILIVQILIVSILIVPILIVPILIVQILIIKKTRQESKKDFKSILSKFIKYKVFRVVF